MSFFDGCLAEREGDQFVYLPEDLKRKLPCPPRASENSSLFWHSFLKLLAAARSVPRPHCVLGRSRTRPRSPPGVSLFGSPRAIICPYHFSPRQTEREQQSCLCQYFHRFWSSRFECATPRSATCYCRFRSYWT